MMSENEMRMLDMIRENDDPELSLLTAINVFSAFLEQLQEAEGLPADGLQGSA